MVVWFIAVCDCSSFCLFLRFAVRCLSVPVVVAVFVPVPVAVCSVAVSCHTPTLTFCFTREENSLTLAYDPRNKT